MNRLQKIVVIAVLLVSACTLLSAQGGATGAIAGTLLDAHGAVIPGAKIAVISDATGKVIRELKTDASGAFNAQLLPAGSYAVEFSAPGFATTKVTGIAVRVTEVSRMTTSLKPSSVKEEVEVHSEVAAIETDTVATGESIGLETVTSMPLATRNFQQLLDLSAGAASQINNAASLGRGDVRINVNGGREDNNNYLIDGISVADYAFGELSNTPVPNPDSIQEFKVGTSLYDATQGRNGGGNINAVLKSGGAKYHGALWEYFRNTDLDAQDYFLGKFVLKQNIFGADLGGPVGQKGGNFYLNYQGTRQRSGDSPGTYISSPALPVLPVNDRSAASLAAAFGLPVGSTVDPTALALLNAKGSQFGPGVGGGWLVPSLAGTVGTSSGSLVLTTPGKYTEDQITSSWDKELNSGRDHVAARFFWSDANQIEPFGADNLQVQTGYPAAATNLNFPLGIPLRGRFGSVAETHSFSPALINEFRAGLNVISDSLQNIPVPGASAADLGINNGSGASDAYRFQLNAWQVGPFPNQGQTAVTHAWVFLDTLSWTRGKHTLRAGGEFDYASMARNLPVLDSDLLIFGNVPLPGQTTTLSDFQNFLLGNPATPLGGGGNANHQYIIPAFSEFLQDDYRASQKLTLNLGLRAESMGAPYDDKCHLGNADPELANTKGFPFLYPSCAKGLAGTQGNPVLNRAALSNEYATVWEPRVGFAYDVLGDHKTVVRGGFGIYSVREDIGAVDNLSFTTPIYEILFGASNPGHMGNIFNGVAPPLGTIGSVPTPSFFTGFNGNGNPNDPANSAQFSGTTFGNFVLAVPLKWIVPTTTQWNFNVQRELVRDWTLELGYVGTKGTHLRSTFDPDQPALANSTATANSNDPNKTVTVACNSPQGVGCLPSSPYTMTASTQGNLTARAPYLGTIPAVFEGFYPNSDSHYEGFQATLSHKFSHGLYLQSAYTFSKSIDDVSTASVAFVTRFNNQNSGAASRGLSDFDRRQRFVTSFNYNLPFFAKRNDFVGKVLGGWEADSVILIQTGAPITILDSALGSAYGLDNPASTGQWAAGYSAKNARTSGSMTAKINNWVNPAAFVGNPGSATPKNPALTQYANAGVYVGPDGSTGYGNSPRNEIEGPGQANVDFTLAKTIKVAETQTVHFRVETFNLFNHPSFATPLTTDTANVQAGSSFAAITHTVGTPRVIQFSLKYAF